MKDHLRELIAQALLDLRRRKTLPADIDDPPFEIERTRSAEHGDYACNAAMVLAKVAKMPPRKLAEAIVAQLPESHHLASAEIAGPGFINFHLSPACRSGVLRRIFELADDYGRQTPDSTESVTIEFVSANPNGPLHVGHGRGAAFGASLASVLEAAGHTVQREYYVNDAGRQMDILAVSVWLRYLDLGGTSVRFPDNGYKGEYVVEIARALRSREGDRLRRTAIEISDNLPPDESQHGDKDTYVDALIIRTRQLLGPDDYRLVFQAGLDWCLADIRDDLSGFGVHHDVFFSERSLMVKPEQGVAEAAQAVTPGSTDSYIERAIALLREHGHLFELDGATWFRATAFGDDKDRVVVRENGVSTYFASDLGYLLSKFDRGFQRAIYVWGADHHGYVTRIKAAAQGLGLDPDKIEIVLVQFAILYRGGERIQMSTRAGSFVTLRELREEVGSDAARFFYVMRSNDQHLDFDLDLAKKHSNDNPVYYVQYAHARICSVFRQLAERQWSYNRSASEAARARLEHPIEHELLSELIDYPDMLQAAAGNRAPQQVANYLRTLAARFHAFYNAQPILVTDEELRNARLGLCAATRQVLANGLALMGVSAPEEM